MMGLLVLLYAFIVYGYSPVNTYKESHLSRSTADFHRQLADKYLERGDFKRAAEEFNSALAIYPQDYESTIGLEEIKTQKLIEDEENYSPEIVVAHLDSLEKEFQNDRNHYLFPYFRGLKQLFEEDYVGALKLFSESVRQNGNFLLAYNKLGDTILRSQCGIDQAAAEHQKVLQRDPQNAVALNNLSQCSIARLHFEDAIKYAERSYSRPSAGAAINRGTAYTLHCDLRRSKDPSCLGNKAEEAYFQDALKIVGATDFSQEDDSYVRDDLIFNYLPLEQDRFAADDYVLVVSIKGYKIVLLYSVSLRYALNKRFEEADKNFDAAYGLDSATRYYDDFVANRIQYILDNLEDVGGDQVRDWLKTRKDKLKPQASE